MASKKKLSLPNLAYLSPFSVLATPFWGVGEGKQKVAQIKKVTYRKVFVAPMLKK